MKQINSNSNCSEFKNRPATSLILHQEPTAAEMQKVTWFALLKTFISNLSMSALLAVVAISMTCIVVKTCENEQSLNAQMQANYQGASK